MSFRIDDILKDKKGTIKEENANNEDKRIHENCWFAQTEQNTFHQNMLLERDRDKINNYFKPMVSCIDYQPHYLPCIGQQSLQFKRHHFPVTYQPVKHCCSRVLPPQTSDKICSASYIYPEKIYSQTTYNHVLPLSFPIYNHYSKRRNQVRFSTSQTKELEHIFSWQKYLSPEDRKLLAYSLKLSDRQKNFLSNLAIKETLIDQLMETFEYAGIQALYARNDADTLIVQTAIKEAHNNHMVKTWFQNRRAKWRRNASASQSSDVKADLSNPPT